MMDGDHERGDPAPAEEVRLPPRLQIVRGPDGERVRRYLRRPHGALEERAWWRLEAALLARSEDRQPRVRRGAVAVLAAVATVGGLLLLFGRREPQPAALAVPGPAQAQRAPEAHAPAAVARGIEPADRNGAARALAPGAATQAIEPGRWIIPGEVSLELAPRSSARAGMLAGGSPALALVRGRITLAVVAKARPTPFRLTAGPYAFVVLGTRFVVDRRQNRIRLDVSEGRVAVVRSGRPLATVSAGGTWSSGVPRRRPAAHLVGATPVTHAPIAPPSPVDPPRMGQAPVPQAVDPGCPEVGPGAPRSARLPCLRAQAAGGGLRAQTALFHIGRILHQERGEPAAALATFEELRRRFPDGPLRTETDLFIVQLLAATGRHREALDESAALLSRGGGPERAAELHLLRGNLYRESLADLPRAEREYRLAADQPLTAPTADQSRALFLHAATLEALGRQPEATERYRRYLDRERPAQEMEARSRLERLERIDRHGPLH
jgi:hypothetical protein